MSTSPVLLESLDDATVLVTLNRPDRRNALTIELMDSLCATFDALAADRTRRVVIVRGAGAGFCSGLDLREAADLAIAEQAAGRVAHLFETIMSSPLVTIAAAHGAAFAGGAGLLGCCDFAVASAELQIGFPEVRRGLIPALVGVVLAHRLRDSELNELFLLAEPITADRALAMGLVQRIAPEKQLLVEAQTLAATIQKGGPEAIRHTKAGLRLLRGDSLSQRLAHALASHKDARRGTEAQEGLNAFLERREPAWSGAS